MGNYWSDSAQFNDSVVICKRVPYQPHIGWFSRPDNQDLVEEMRDAGVLFGIVQPPHTVDMSLIQKYISHYHSWEPKGIAILRLSTADQKSHCLWVFDMRGMAHDILNVHRPDDLTPELLDWMEENMARPVDVDERGMTFIVSTKPYHILERGEANCYMSNKYQISWESWNRACDDYYE